MMGAWMYAWLHNCDRYIKTGTNVTGIWQHGRRWRLCLYWFVRNKMGGFPAEVSCQAMVMGMFLGLGSAWVRRESRAWRSCFNGLLLSFLSPVCALRVVEYDERTWHLEGEREGEQAEELEQSPCCIVVEIAAWGTQRERSNTYDSLFPYFMFSLHLSQLTPLSFVLWLVYFGPSIGEVGA
ncbi:hypothetical protein B0T19DRAFT_88597 [Cercophora scortea]|uniref:Uncharacterized protein n=1 Tax=Cercophora scortea TaxID=314031 RepID=A0AAE0MHH9_9PEZI|nr:hypothetical protein B0T19DRAFT_88597 [Cercophora scortea]